MRSLHPEVAEALKLHKKDAPRPLMATECSLADAQPNQHKHSITVEQCNTADITAPVVHRAVVTDKQSTPQPTYKGLSVSPEQLSELTAQRL